jgi:hypothetical protein
LANKQDRRGAINKEDDIKEKLEIEKLKRKHKIVNYRIILNILEFLSFFFFFIKEFCTAIPGENNKTNDSIRQGFSWLIRTIETNYTQLNSRINHTKNSHLSRPIDRKPPSKNLQKIE